MAGSTARYVFHHHHHYRRRRPSRNAAQRRAMPRNEPARGPLPAAHPTTTLANVTSLPPNSKIIPLLVLLLVVAGIGFVCYQVYIGATKIRENAENSFASRNVVFTKDGVKVGVKHVENERYVDATQSWVVKAWNAGSAANNKQPASKRRRG
ncbi:hypothetical protein F4859DRAFT_273965 [Xylaria cf. heliscus]|nr:hypothetical protein F4859DRAFT_273965 [Xylaria cf. heliscus]